MMYDALTVLGYNLIIAGIIALFVWWYIFLSLIVDERNFNLIRSFSWKRCVLSHLAVALVILLGAVVLNVR